MKYPQNILSSTGSPLVISPIVANLKSFMDLSLRERADYLAKILGTEPTFEDFQDALTELLFLDDLEYEWERIQQLDWDTSFKKKTDIGIELKRDWRNVTGENYGSDKAETWYPEGFGPELLKMDVHELEADIKRKNKEFEKAIAHKAVSEDEIARLEELAGKVGQLQEEEKKAIELLTKFDSVHYDLKMNYKAQCNVPKPHQRCPYCGRDLDIVRGVIVEVQEEKVEYKRMSERELEILKKSVDLAKKALDETKDLEAVSSMKYKEAIEASKRLLEIKSTVIDKKGAKSNESAREDLEQAQRTLQTFNDKIRADGIHQQICNNQVLIDALAPDGLRKNALEKTIESVNAGIADLCSVASFPKIRLDSDLGIWYGDIPYLLCSKAQMLWCRIVMQVYIAKLEQAQIMIIDDVETFVDSEGRNNVFSLITNTEIPTLMFIALPERKLLPDLSKLIKGGRSYWIENNTLI